MHFAATRAYFERLFSSTSQTGARISTPLPNRGCQLQLRDGSFHVGQGRVRVVLRGKCPVRALWLPCSDDREDPQSALGNEDPPLVEGKCGQNVSCRFAAPPRYAMLQGLVKALCKYGSICAVRGFHFRPELYGPHQYRDLSRLSKFSSKWRRSRSAAASDICTRRVVHRPGDI